MRIGYFADGVWAHQALDRILATPQLEVVFIVARFNSPDPVLKRYAKKLKVPYLVHQNVNLPDFIARIQEYCADLYVSMSFDQIFKANIIKATPKGFINCHAGTLPFYRGRNVLNWALINGEKKFGVTVHYVSEGIDTGDIVLQRYSEIDLLDDYGSVLSKATSLCADTLHEALLVIEEDRVQFIKQNSIHPVGFYCGRRGPGDEYLNWEWTSERIYNFVRAITFPGPCARTFLKKQELAIVQTELISDAPVYIGTVGEIVGRNATSVMIKTGDSTLRITKVADVTKTGNIVNERTPSFPIGMRLGLNLRTEMKRMEARIDKLEKVINNFRGGADTPGF